MKKTKQALSKLRQKVMLKEPLSNNINLNLKNTFNKKKLLEKYNFFNNILTKTSNHTKKFLNKYVFLREENVFYIAGSETLPAPLDSEKERETILKLGTDEHEEARLLLIEHNLRLVVYIAKRFENTGISLEDLISIGTIGLIKAINTFKNDKNIKLATYASRCIENEILMFLRKNNRTRGDISIDEPLNVDFDGNELLLADILGTEGNLCNKDIEFQTEKTLLFKALESLNTRERKIIELRFGINTDGDELTQKEVADLLGISQSYISRLEKKIFERLRKSMVKFM